MKKLLFLIFILFVGCSTRQYYKPEHSLDLNIEFKDLNSSIKYFTRDVATLNDGLVIPVNSKLNSDFLALSSDISINANVLNIKNKKMRFKKLIVTASHRENLLAVIFSDNSIKLINIDNNEIIFSKKFKNSLANRKFIAKPYFYKDLLLIPTLNGKLVVFDITSKKIVRTIILSKKDYFNNVIYLGVRNNNLIVATRDIILVISPGMIYDAEFNIKHILVGDKYIYVFTNEGDVLKLNLRLKVLKKKSFKFANIVSPTLYNNYLYFLDNGKNTYLIKTNSDLNNTSVYNLNENIDDKNVFSKKGILYIGDKYINLKDIK